MKRIREIDAPCKIACPGGIDLPRCHRFIIEGKWDEALSLLREKVPFPASLGRVCIAPCESQCQPTFIKKDPIAIRILHRLVTEKANELPMPVVKKNSGKRIAIIGSGPCGLTAAYYLALLGHGVVVFEALSRPGGMMRVGIPDYRLPKGILDKEIHAVEQAGVEIRLNKKIRSVDRLLRDGFQAVMVATGAHRPAKMGIPGENSAGVLDSTSFLRNINLGKRVKMGKKVIVFGGGNSAIDAARVCRRLNAQEVSIVYRRSRKEMPASSYEVDEAIREGVKIEFLSAPTKIVRTNDSIRIDCVRMKLKGVDATGRKKPEQIPNSKFRINADTVISAVGQLPDIPAPAGLADPKGNMIRVNPDTLATNLKGVFAGGDAIPGRAWVIKAIADGRKAAISVDEYLGGDGRFAEDLVLPEENISTKTLPQFPLSYSDRAAIPLAPVTEGINGFAEVENGLPEGAGIEEAKRCLWCDLEPWIKDLNKCALCSSCQFRCSLIYTGSFNQNLSGITISEMKPADKKMIFNAHCIGCSICARYCTYDAIELRRKVEG